MTDLEPARHLIVARPGERPEVAYSDLDYSVTVDTAEALIAAVPPNTRRAYDVAWDRLSRWCESTGRVALPATPQTLAEYMRVLTGIDLAPNTIDQAVGCIRARHRDAGYKDQPDTKPALRLLREYRKAWADHGGRVRKRLPILIPALRAMVATCDPDTLAGVRDRAILLLGFNMMGRRSEVAGLDIPDLRAAGDNGIEVFVRYSKTDQDAQGVSVPVPFGQHVETCAVRSVRAWTAILADREWNPTGAVFRPIDRHGTIGDEPGAAGHTAGRLTGHSVNAIVRRRARLAGLDDADQYGAHGLRSGAATVAYAHGIPVSVIAEHGRWSPHSPVVLGYLRAVDGWTHNPMKGIGL